MLLLNQLQAMPKNSIVTFHNANLTAKFVVKRTKCRHYTMAIVCKLTGKKSAFKRVKKAFVINLAKANLYKRELLNNVRKQEQKPVVQKISKVKKSVQIVTGITKKLIRGFTSKNKSDNIQTHLLNNFKKASV